MNKLPRKLKKAMDGLLIDPDSGRVFFNSWYRNYRRYPRTKWVVRAERQFRRTWLESVQKEEKFRVLSLVLEEMKRYENTGF